MSPTLVTCVMIGDSIVDTTNLFMRRLAGQFRSGDKERAGCEFGVINLVLGDEIVILKMRDLKVTNQFKHGWTIHCTGVNCAILPFDLSHTKYSFFKFHGLITQIRRSAGEIPILLLGCYNDSGNEKHLSQELIEQLITDWPNVFYQEYPQSNPDLTAVTIPAAILGLNQQGVSISNLRVKDLSLAMIAHRLEEKERKKKKQLEELVETVEQMGLSVNQNYTLELNTHHGVFFIDILKEKVHFKPQGCLSCKRFSCITRYNASANPLCIILDSEGWSNLTLKNSYLLILSEILAIQEDKLPMHVLDQIEKICPGYCEAKIVDHYRPEEIIANFLNNQSTKNDRITPTEARALLRHYYTQYRLGQIPFSVYYSLKERYHKF